MEFVMSLKKINDSIFYILKIVVEDFQVNRNNGILCVLMLILYRVGSSIQQVHVNRKPPIRWILRILLSLIEIPKNLLCLLFGCFLPFSAKIGRRVEFRHSFYGIFISQSAILGDNIILFQQVTIGSNFDTSDKAGAPSIGNAVLIGAGAKIIGDIVVGERARIGANATVTKDVKKNVTIVPVNKILIH
jgi:serine acetyltransferase